MDKGQTNSELLKWKPRGLPWLQTAVALICLLCLAAGQRAAMAQTLSNESAWDDGTNIHYEATYTGSYPNFNVYLDTDLNAATGYSISGIGGDYLIENTGLYKSTANGTAWDWSELSTTVTETVPQSGTVEFTFPVSAIGNPPEAYIVFQVETSSWVGTTDPHVITYWGIPVPPAGLTATPGNAQVSLSWTASPGASSYNIYRGTTSGGESSTAIATGITSTSYTNTGLINGVKYYYTASATDGSGTSAYSSEVNATPSGGGTTVATPTFSPAAGTYSSTQSVTISDATSGASIYYTTNGTTPTTSSTHYTGAISVTSSETIEAIAAASGDTNSAVASAAYTISASTAATPTFSPGAGTYTGTQSVTISDTTSGATIYYTTNGTTPTTSSTHYTGAISVTSSETIEAFATASGYSNSSVGSATYTISTGGGAYYYVSPTGSDSNSGSSSSPWLTPQHAANTVGPGATVYLEEGTYAPFQVNVSGSASGGYITFTSYPGETATIDGTGWTGSYDDGLVYIFSESYIIISGLQLQNASSSSTSFGPCGVCVKDTSNYIEILNNSIHNISTSASGGNAHGILCRGEIAGSGSAMTNVLVSGNQIYDCTTGDSEALTMAGNLNTFTVSNNTVDNNDNIGIDCEGGYSSIASGAQATNGTVTGNTVYDCSTIDNPDAGDVYECAGLYDDGATYVVFQGNVVYGCDIGVQVSSENSGYYSSNVTVRNNLIYENQTYGIAIGGYAASGVGGSENDTFVNNTLYDDDLQDWWCGEIGLRYQATGILCDNNIIYAGSSNDVFVKDISSSVGTFNYNDYYSLGGSTNAKWQWANQSSWDDGLAAWQSESGQDANSTFASPLFDSLSSPLNFNITSGSPALNSGDYGLGSSDYGTLDFAGNARTKGSTIDMGAFED